MMEAMIYFIKERIFYKITNSVTKMFLYAHGRISKKNLCGECTRTPDTQCIVDDGTTEGAKKP